MGNGQRQGPCDTSANVGGYSRGCKCPRCRTSITKVETESRRGCIGESGSRKKTGIFSTIDGANDNFVGDKSSEKGVESGVCNTCKGGGGLFVCGAWGRGGGDSPSP